MERYVRVLAFALLISVFPLLAQGAVAAEPPHISAQAASVIDVHSGRFLYEKNADERKPIASITKIMTAIIAIEHGDLDEKVTVGARAARQEGSSLYLKSGEKMTLRHLLYGLMLRSGNDAAVAIAEHIGGSVPGFSVLMNEKSEYLGMTNTHFVNPHGLDAENHYSTARDMAKLTAYALNNDVFQKIVATQTINVPNPGEKWDRKWYNKNKMLHLYAGADGVKTGYTSRAKRTLVSSATRDGQQLVTVTLNAPDDWNDSIALLNYGFEQFPLRTLVDGREPVSHAVNRELEAHGLQIVPERVFTYPLSEQELSSVETNVDIPGGLPQDLQPGVRVGEVQIELEGEQIGSVPLIVAEVPRDEDAVRLWDRWTALISPLWGGGSP